MVVWRFAGKIALVIGTLLQCSVAAELTDLYQARVSADSKNWQAEALQAVLVKLTGPNAVGLQSESKLAASFVVQYQQVQTNGKQELLVSLDTQKVNQLLEQRQLPIWGPRRADILLFVTERLVDAPRFVQSDAHPLRQTFAAQSQRLGLPLTYPLLDEAELAVLNENVTFSGDWTVLNQVAERYQTNEVINLLFDQFTDPAGLVQFRLTWQQWQDNAVQTQELVGVDAVKLAEQFMAWLANQQFNKYAVKVSTAGTLQLTLQISGLDSFTDVVKMQQTLTSMLTVKSSQLLSYSKGLAQIALQLSASEDEFYRNLALVKEFTALAEESSPLVTAEADATSGDINNPSMNVATTAQPGVAEQPSGTEQDALAREAMLEAALNQPTSSSESATPEPQTVPRAAMPIKSTRYRYQRP